MANRVEERLGPVGESGVAVSGEKVKKSQEFKEKLSKRTADKLLWLRSGEKKSRMNPGFNKSSQGLGKIT